MARVQGAHGGDESHGLLLPTRLRNERSQCIGTRVHLRRCLRGVHGTHGTTPSKGCIALIAAMLSAKIASLSFPSSRNSGPHGDCRNTSARQDDHSSSSQAAYTDVLFSQITNLGETTDWLRSASS